MDHQDDLALEWFARALLHHLASHTLADEEARLLPLDHRHGAGVGDKAINGENGFGGGRALARHCHDRSNRRTPDKALHDVPPGVS